VPIVNHPDLAEVCPDQVLAQGVMSMDRMEHFREAKILENGQVVLDHVEGYLGFHAKPNGRKQWHGYVELKPDQHVSAGVHLELQMADGRVAEINAAEVRDSDTPGRNIHIAEFYVIGDVRMARRGLRDGAQRPTLG
jgi:hypothetical protein